MPNVKRGFRLRSGLFILLLTGCLAIPVFHFQVFSLLSSYPRLTGELLSGTEFHLQVTDSSSEWNWSWNEESCQQAFAQWLQPLGMRALELNLINPQTHELGLPLWALFEPGPDHSAMAGAWCEPAGSQSAPAVKCKAAPLEATGPDVATTALIGALAQAISYAHNPEVFGEAQGRAWDWSQWQPLVAPDSELGWRSVCPPLAEEVAHE